MNQYPQIQQPHAQQQPGNQLSHNQPVAVKPEQSVSTTETAIAPSFGQIDTVALVKTGGITSAIILSIALLILALAEYNKVFLPVMLQKRNERNK